MAMGSRRLRAIAVAPWLACAAGAVVLSAAPAGAQAPATAPAAAAAEPEAEVAQITAPVVLDHETLFRVRGAPSLPAEERARRIAERIADVARTASIAPEAVRAGEAEGTWNVKAGDRLLLVVTDGDARLEGLERPLLARTYADRIERGVRSYRQARDPQVLLRGAWRALGASVVFLVAVFLLRWAFRRLEAGFVRGGEARIRSVEIQSFEVLRGERLKDAFRASCGSCAR